MKHKLQLLVCLFILGMSQIGWSAFLVKRDVRVTTSSVAPPSESNIFIRHNRSKLSDIACKITHPLDSFIPRRHGRNIHGTLSLIFGIIGIIGSVPGIPFSIAAIVLGVIGLRNHERFANAGLILGIISLAIILLVLILLFASVGVF